MQKVTTKATDLIHAVFIPFADPTKIKNKKSQGNGDNLHIENDTSYSILNGKKPKRPPRFFFKSTYLIPYSSIKAKLQMAIDSLDIEQGVIFFSNFFSNFQKNSKKVFYSHL